MRKQFIPGTLEKDNRLGYNRNMDIETINALEKAIKAENLLKKYNLDKIGVFGSFARGEKANDIDFFIDIENYDIKNLIELKKDLEKITEKEVDIMLRKYANPILLYRAQKDMKYVIQ
jgi:predicted nucleotidyltransferase